MSDTSAANKVARAKSPLHRRLLRCIWDYRYRFGYVPRFLPEDCWHLLQGRFLMLDLWAPREIPREALFQQEARRFLDWINPPWAWTDWAGNILFLGGCWTVLLWSGHKSRFAEPFPVVVLVCLIRRLLRLDRQNRIWRHWIRDRVREQAERRGSGAAS